MLAKNKLLLKPKFDDEKIVGIIKKIEDGFTEEYIDDEIYFKVVR